MKLKNWKPYLLSALIALGIGGLSGFLSMEGMGYYTEYVTKPALTPPGWLFPVVWTILYLLMGYAAYRAGQSGSDWQEIYKAKRLYWIQLALNFLWSPVFFGLKRYLLAFFILVALWILIYLTMVRFSKLDKLAGDLLIPYLLWVTFAGYLNFGVFLLN